MHYYYPKNTAKFHHYLRLLMCVTVLRPLGGNEMRLHLVKARLMIECENIISDHALVGVKLTALSTSATAATGAGVVSMAPLVTIVVVVAAAAASSVSILTGLDTVPPVVGGAAEAAGEARVMACRRL